METNLDFGPYNAGSQIGQNHGPIYNDFSATANRPETPSEPLSTIPYPEDRNYVSRPVTKELHNWLHTDTSWIALVGIGGVGYVLSICPRTILGLRA